MRLFAIGESLFTSKKEARDAARQLLYCVDPGQLLPEAEFAFAMDLLAMHPRFAEKVVGGCRAIRVRWNKLPGQGRTRGLWVVHDDGTETDVSVYAPFEAEAQRYRKKVTGAARAAVKDSVLSVKQAAFAGGTARCAITGVEVTWEEAHVDHSPECSFEYILREWLKTLGREPVLLDEGLGAQFIADDERGFREFHDARAVLRVVHGAANIRRRGWVWPEE